MPRRLTTVLLLRHAEIASVQSHAENALQQLAAVREQEQLQLQRRAEALQRDFRESIAELEHRYALQVGHPGDTFCDAFPSHPGPCIMHIRIRCTLKGQRPALTFSWLQLMSTNRTMRFTLPDMYCAS